MIKVAIAGALGRMGQAVKEAVLQADGLQLVCGIDLKSSDHSPDEPYAVTDDLLSAIHAARPDVLVDFTIAEAAASNALVALQNGVRPVIGTSGLSQEQTAAIDALSRERKLGAFLAPNFALGAVLMMYFARVASRYFDSAEVIELHHDRKVDAPSGTAVKTVAEMAASHGKPFSSNNPSKEPLPGARGAEWSGVRVHSVRLPGLHSHQEVLFGGQGQVLSIRHDTINDTAFMPGILIAINEVMNRDRLVVGLDELLGLA